MLKGENYAQFIESRLKIIDKTGTTRQFILNPVQRRFLVEDSKDRNIILKARQQGFSSLILAIFTADFLFKENCTNVVVADVTDNAVALLDRVKFYIKSYEEATGIKIPLKYNSKYQLYNEANNNYYTIGTAENVDFGRSRTVTNLHMSECAFYKDLTKMLAGALQAVVPGGFVCLETTANGFNEFKELWDQSTIGEATFAPLFYPASAFYDKDFLTGKKKELGRMYVQEYPETAEEAFLTSGSPYFDIESMQMYSKYTKEPMEKDLIYA